MVMNLSVFLCLALNDWVSDCLSDCVSLCVCLSLSECEYSILSELLCGSVCVFVTGSLYLPNCLSLYFCLFAFPHGDSVGVSVILVPVSIWHPLLMSLLAVFVSFFGFVFSCLSLFVYVFDCHPH